MANLRADSTEYWTATFTTDHDTTGDVVEVAFPAKNGDIESWHAAEVLSVAETPAGSGKWVTTYRVLIGPAGGTVALAPGSYLWLVRITDTPEQPVRQADTLTVI